MYKRYLLIIAVACAPLQPSDPAHIKTWQKQYFLDKNLGQQYLNALAAFIAYLMQARPDDAQKHLQDSVSATIKSVSTINGVENKVPNNFRLALIKVFKNAYMQAHSDTLKMEQQKKLQLAATLARRKKNLASKKSDGPETEAASNAVIIKEEPNGQEEDLSDIEQSKKPAPIDRCAWKQALNNYYATIYPLLDKHHQTFIYGQRRGKTLPLAKPIKMTLPPSC